MNQMDEPIELKKGTVSALPVRSLYSNGHVKFKTKLSVVPDDKMFDFTSDEDSPYFEVSAKATDAKITLGHRNTSIIDCGVNVSMPAGYRLTAFPTEQNARRGLIVTYVDTLDNRLRVAVTNVGKEIVILEHGEKFAIICVEPICFIDWKNNQS